MSYATLLCFAVFCFIQREQKEDEWLRLGENYPHLTVFLHLNSVQEQISQMFSIPPFLWDHVPLLAPNVPSVIQPAFLHLLMVAPGRGWRQSPIHASSQVMEPSWAGEQAGHLGHQQLCRGIFGKVLWKYQDGWDREGSSARGLNLLAGSHHVGCDHLHSGVQGNFLLIGPGTTPGEQLAHGTCASWAIQKHEMLQVRPNPPSWVVFFSAHRILRRPFICCSLHPLAL